MESLSTIISELQKGNFVVVHDEHREKEADFFLLAEHVTPEKINFLLTHAKGLICIASDKSLLDKMYQAVKKFSLIQKVALINKYANKNKTLLDFGAGTGDFLLEAKNREWSVQGIEPSEDARARSLQKKMELLS